MALKGEIKKIKDGGVEKEQFVVEFTNGTYEQIKEIKNFLVKEGVILDTASLEKVIEVAIAFIERLKENKNKENK